ncbi:olfactory receptor 52M1-like [Pleurodeles waltl]|uniref:olfactory receptor 52M1-like n=1 Tax=Pleurodeles waltl TaxID=8319 RepID=UPI0037098914
MNIANGSYCIHPTVFLLVGIPELEHLHLWMSIPFCSMFILAILGNCTILLIIRSEKSLHEPMYLLLCILGVIDLILASSTVPKMLTIFWFEYREIYFDSCLVQMYFVHSLAIMESGIFLAMAFDRYVAICYPLRHAMILTNPMIGRIGMAAVLRGLLYILPLPLLIQRLVYYRTNVISHSYCEHMAVVSLSCDDNTINNIYGLTIGFLVLIADSILISFSYFMIVRAVLGLASLQAQLKTFNTCTSHICAILSFYMPIAISSLSHRFGHNIPPPTHILLANFYLLVPPVLNPLVYTIKTKQIRKRVSRMLCRI